MTIAADPPLWLQNGQYAARLDRQLIAAMSPEGILRGLAVTPHTPAPDYSVSIAEGMAIIQGDNENDQGAYLALLPDPVSVSVAAPAGSGRIDRIVLRVNDPQAGGPAGDNTTVEVIQGTPAGSPVAPTLPATAIELARVTLTASTTAVTSAQISGTNRTFARAVGVIEAFAGSAAPAWGLICDGSAKSRTDYADLFSVIGTLWGIGDGSATFNLPDLRGCAPVGYTAADPLFSAVGKKGGSKNSVVVAHAHPIPHDHPNSNTSSAGNHNHNYSRMVEDNIFAQGTRNGGASLTTVSTGTEGAHVHVVNVTPAPSTQKSGAADGGVSGTNMNLPPFGVVNFVIRV